MNPVVKKILNIALDVVIAILVIFAVFISMVAVSSNANQNVPQVFGYSPLSVQSGSMSPTFDDGDYIFVDTFENAEEAKQTLKKGDVITFWTYENGHRILNTHRIVTVVNHDGFLSYETKGDANSQADDVWITPGDVVGKYTGTSIPYMGDVMDFLSSKWGFFCVILLPILLFTLYQVYRLVSTIMHNKKVDMANQVAELASDDVKDAIIAQYLEQQALEQQTAEPTEDQQSQDEISE